MKIASAGELKATNFKFNTVGMERLGKKEPCLFLMNHTSFLDLKIAVTMLYPRKFNIVMTSDGFVGKRNFMRNLGCIPTNKFITDTALVRNMLHCVNELKTSVLLFPEASYTFDGTATTLPYGLGKLVKLLNVPVVMLKTQGVFLHDPLYNGLQLRKANVSATMEYLFSQRDVKEKSVDDLNATINDRFTFDGFRYQQENDIVVDEPFRADGLDRVLYKCPHCLKEGATVGKGTKLTCNSCGAVYELDEHGYLVNENGDTKFNHVPDWYKWERQCVKEEIERGEYLLDVDVNAYVMKGYKAVYDVGTGHLTHDKNGFRLIGADGKLNYVQPASASYSLYSDYLWYEIADVICIGNNEMLYYCFPQNVNGVVAKTRLATEEIYKMTKGK